MTRSEAGRLRRKHGMAMADGKRAPEYRTWSMMRNRCRNPRARDYGRYGGRGITICRAWDSFEAFYADMGPRPSAAHSIDRRDNNGNYTPDNCRWATQAQQQCNRRNTPLFTVGSVADTLTGWARRLTIPHSTLRRRVATDAHFLQRAAS